MPYDIEPHILLGKGLNVHYAILPGDPGRVDRARHYLTDVEDLAFNREYKSITGYYKNTKILVLSTGIGGPSTGIAIEELANIGVTHLIRIGSCGALQDDMQLGDLIIATGAVRDEGTSQSYINNNYPAVPNHNLTENIREASESYGAPFHLGLVRSHDSFYTDKEDNISCFWSGKGILGSDMETSSLFVLGRLRGLKTASLLNVVVPSQGSLESGINEYVQGENDTVEGEKREIYIALETFSCLASKKLKER